VEAIAACDVVAAQGLTHAIVNEGDLGRVRIHATKVHLGHFEQQRQAGRETHGHEVLDDFLLPVDRHRLAGERIEIDAVCAATEHQLDTVVADRLARQPRPGADRFDDRGSLVFQHAGAHAVLDVLTGPGFQDHRSDAGLRQQLAQQQARGAGADDCNLGAHAGNPRA